MTASKRLLLLASVLLLAMGCDGTPRKLRTGDLIFVGIPAGAGRDGGSMDAAISAATGTPGQLNLIHVAIVDVCPDGIRIIDATPRRGVDRHPLDTFLADFLLPDGSSPVFIVKRVSGADTDAAVRRARALCGRDYDFLFLPDNEALYCSELVQRCYLDADGKPLFGSEPMNFLAPDGTLPPYWDSLFRAQGMDVPQGLPGTNPQRMSEAGCLQETGNL